MIKLMLSEVILIKAKSWDSSSVEKLIEVFTPRINSLINSFSYRTSDLRDDCIQSAYICLLNCCSLYDHDISKNFPGFVIVSMKNAILNCLKQEATQTRRISISSSTYSEYDVTQAFEFNYDLEEDVLEQIYLEKLNTDMENGYYSMSNVKLFKAICGANFDIKLYAKENDILISTLYKQILRLKQKIKNRLHSPNAGNGVKFEAHKIISLPKA